MSLAQMCTQICTPQCHSPSPGLCISLLDNYTSLLCGSVTKVSPHPGQAPLWLKHGSCINHVSLPSLKLSNGLPAPSGGNPISYIFSISFIMMSQNIFSSPSLCLLPFLMLYPSLTSYSSIPKHTLPWTSASTWGCSFCTECSPSFPTWSTPPYPLRPRSKLIFSGCVRQPWSLPSRSSNQAGRHPTSWFALSHFPTI